MLSKASPLKTAKFSSTAAPDSALAYPHTPSINLLYDEINEILRQQDTHTINDTYFTQMINEETGENLLKNLVEGTVVKCYERTLSHQQLHWQKTAHVRAEVKLLGPTSHPLGLDRSLLFNQFIQLSAGTLPSQVPLSPIIISLDSLFALASLVYERMGLAPHIDIRIRAVATHSPELYALHYAIPVNCAATTPSFSTSLLEGLSKELTYLDLKNYLERVLELLIVTYPLNMVLVVGKTFETLMDQMRQLYAQKCAVGLMISLSTKLH